MDGCACSAVYGRICDGVPELRKAARDEIRKGASQIKIMASGGLSSPTDRADGVQFAIDEIKAAVEEADSAGIYVMAHAAPARAVKRALQCGVRSIEHGHYMDDECLDLLIEKQAFYVPTMAIRYTLLREGLEAGFPAVSHAKLLAATGGTIEQSQRVFERAHRRGIKMVYGTDLLGILHRHQAIEMDLRSEVESPAEVIRSATLHAAELFQCVGEIGVVAIGARADLLVVDGDPLRDLGLLKHQGRHLNLIMKGGQIYKNEL
jgi:imidazolonepropionase-like amidohydrolase